MDIYKLKEIDERLLNIINDPNGDYDYIVRQADKARIILQELIVVLLQANVIKSVCDQCRFESDCRFKVENVEQNCKFFIDKQTVL